MQVAEYSSWYDGAEHYGHGLFGEGDTSSEPECDQDLLEYVGHGSFQDMIEASDIVLNRGKESKGLT